MMDGLSFQKILQCGYCIFILNPSCLHCHPCGLPSDDDLQKWRNVIHLPAIDQSNLSPSLFDSPKTTTLLHFALIYPFNLYFLSL